MRYYWYHLPSPQRRVPVALNLGPVNRLPVFHIGPSVRGPAGDEQRGYYQRNSGATPWSHARMAYKIQSASENILPLPINCTSCDRFKNRQRKQFGGLWITEDHHAGSVLGRVPTCATGSTCESITILTGYDGIILP